MTLRLSVLDQSPIISGHTPAQARLALGGRVFIYA